MNEALVTIVIPNYNGKHFLEACLSSLEEQSFCDFKTLVVDNGSTDGSVEFLKSVYPEVEILEFAENHGFCRAVNEGIKKSDTPYVFLLNNDTTVDPYCLEALVNAIKKKRGAFSVACKMIQMMNPELLDSAGDLYTVLGWAVNRGVGRGKDCYSRASRIFSACGGAALYRREVFDEIGFFDEAHFAYLEDVDIGYRAKIYGYYNLYCPDAKVYHVGSGSTGSRYNDFKVSLSARNSVYLVHKNMPLLQRIINLPTIALGHLVKAAFFSATGFGKAYRRGLREGFTTLDKVQKVPHSITRLPRYVLIQAELICGTFCYALEWVRRKSESGKQTDQ